MCVRRKTNSTLVEKQEGCLIKVPPGRGGFGLVLAQGLLSCSQPVSPGRGRAIAECLNSCGRWSQLLLHPLGHSFCKQKRVKMCVPKARAGGWWKGFWGVRTTNR